MYSKVREDAPDIDLHSGEEAAPKNRYADVVLKLPPAYARGREDADSSPRLFPARTTEPPLPVPSLLERAERPRLRPLVRGPWPQPSPWFPNHMVPAVLHIPEEVRRDWVENVKSRYVRQLMTETPGAYLWALRNPGLREVPDERFVELLCDGIIARFLTPELDLADLLLFGDLADDTYEDDGSTVYKADFRIIGLVAPDAESNAAPCVVLFRRSREGRYRVVAISVDDDVYEPHEGPSWELAKYFALQAAGVSTTLHMHPRLHFPTDAIDAIARTRLPDGHVLKELLRPHLRLELGVSDAVLHGERSVLRPGHVYSPYPGTHEENLRLVGTIWTGFPHADGTANSSYPPYRFPMRPRTIHAPYGVFLDRYFATIRRFVAAVLATMDTNEDDLVDFATHVSRWIPGFPDGTEVRDPSVLASAIASVIFSVSVAHSADHFLYGQVDPREVPFRIKAERPTHGMTEFDRTAMVDTRDLVAGRMCSRMYFQPHVLERLVDADYRFEGEALKGAVARFREELVLTEVGLLADGHRVYVPLDSIATSVQY